MRILGIDPGLRRTGFGVVDADGMRLRYVASGTIVVPPSLALSERLKVILDNLRQVAQETRPDVAALEIVFLNTNPASTLLLGQARGAALCALADSALAVHEYTALQIKKAVVGTGRAAKEQVQMMVQHLLSLDGTPAPTRPTRWPAPSATRTPGRCRTSSAAWARRWAAAIPGCETAAWSAEPPRPPAVRAARIESPHPAAHPRGSTFHAIFPP